MAIYHLSMKPISRSSGRSAVAAAAYRCGEKLENQRDGRVHDFSQRSGVEHTEIVLPKDVDADWARERLTLWNAAEAAEKRKDGRVAREIEVSLPHELSSKQQLELTQSFAQSLANRYGVAVDFAIHRAHGKGDARNQHAHLMMTTRQVGISGLEEKSKLELENKKLQSLGLATSHEQLRSIRIAWEELSNEQLARAGLELRIDHRSHQDCGLEIEPTQHLGVQATQMARRGQQISRTRLDKAAVCHNTELIRQKPEQVLMLLTNEKSVFSRYDVARMLHRYIDEAEAFQAALAQVMGSENLVTLQTEQSGSQARYSTREMVSIEREMALSAERLVKGRGFGVTAWPTAIGTRWGLADEQLAAVKHVTGPERAAVVVGLAGAGKSTMLAAAREAWESAGYRVRGAALSGKAAEGLEESAGIGSRTLASWSRGWKAGFDRLESRDVLVIDEAGMVGSKQLGQFISEVEQRGAKIVLVGDPEQLQPIGPGAALRAVAERIGLVELKGVKRQHEDWQRAASVDFGRQRTAEGLASYAERGCIRFEESSDSAREALVQAVMADLVARPQGSRLVLAHRRADVQVLNEAIRSARQQRGELAGELWYQTTEGERAFAPGDRLLFRENNQHMRVKNGLLGTVECVEEGGVKVRLDSAQGPGQGRTVSVCIADYAAVDHGYATTIHKAQGMTVERAYVLGSGTMDRHLIYVAMTRHREAVTLYVDRGEFSDLRALSARLERSQAKETTLDYEQACYAGRRGLLQESEILIPEVVRELSMFDGLQLNSGRGISQAALGEGLASARLSSQEQSSALEPRTMRGDLARAVERYARAWIDVERMREQALPVLEHQKAALQSSGVALDRAQPGAQRDFLSAIEHQPAIYKAMREKPGSARTKQLMAGIEHEARVRQTPELKAERVVKLWSGLEAQYEKLQGLEQAEARNQVTERLQVLAEELKRDPELKALLRQQPSLRVPEGSWLAQVISGQRDVDKDIRHGPHNDWELGL